MQSGQQGRPAQYWLFNSRTKKLVAGPAETLAQLKNSAKVKALKPLKARERRREGQDRGRRERADDDARLPDAATRC